MVQAIGRGDDRFPTDLVSGREMYDGLGMCEKRKRSQASVLDGMGLQAMGRDNDTVPSAFLLKNYMVHGSYLVVLLKIVVDVIGRDP